METIQEIRTYIKSEIKRCNAVDTYPAFEMACAYKRALDCLNCGDSLNRAIGQLNDIIDPILLDEYSGVSDYHRNVLIEVQAHLTKALYL